MRVRDGFDVAKGQLTNYNQSGGIIQSIPFNGTTKCLGQYQSISTDKEVGRFTPGILRLNPIVIRKAVGSCTSGVLGRSTWSYDYGREMYVGPYAARWAPLQFGSWDTQLAELCRTRAIASVNRPTVGLGVILGELTETIELFKHPLRSLSKNLSRLRRARKSLRRLGRSVQTVNSEFLKAQYGILPLMRDIEDLRTAYHDKVRYHANLLRSSKSTLSKRLPDTVWDQNLQVDWLRCRLYTVQSTHIMSTCAVYYQHLLDIEAKHTAGFWGLGPQDILNVGYQLIPYTFVLDWFINLGTWLRAIVPNPDIAKLGGCTSQKISVTLTSKPLPPFTLNGAAAYKLDQVQESIYTWNSEQLIRQIVSTNVGMPTWETLPLTLERGVSGVALLIQKCASKLG